MSFLLLPTVSFLSLVCRLVCRSHTIFSFLLLSLFGSLPLLPHLPHLSQRPHLPLSTPSPPPLPLLVCFYIPSQTNNPDHSNHTIPLVGRNGCLSRSRCRGRVAACCCCFCGSSCRCVANRLIWLTWLLTWLLIWFLTPRFFPAVPQELHAAGGAD